MTATKSSNYFELYKRRRHELLALGREQLGLVNALEMDETQADGVKPGEVLAGLLNRLETDTLRVLVIGRFSAGKSTFLNALFGELILPSSPAPTTGVICEIRYADDDKKKATLFPKPGMGENGDEPFDLNNIGSIHRELSRYVKIDHSGDAMATSRYQKLELHWPLPLCRDGVELIDSVGLDDPDSRETVTMEYAKSADAILYCMNSLQAYTARDKQALGLLRSLGYENIFFIITYYDHIKDAVDAGETTEESFRSDTARNLAQWSELKTAGIKYVDSKSALAGRGGGNTAIVRESGIEEIETALEKFLTQEKGRAKLQTSLRSLRSVNRLVRTVIPPRIGMWQTPNETLERRYKEAKPRLDNLEQTRSLIVESAALSVRDIARHAREMAAEYFLGMPDKVKDWAEAYEIEVGFGMPPKLEPVVKEVVEQLKSQIQQDLADWSRTALMPAIQERIRALGESLEGRASDFFRTVDQIRIELSMGSEVDATVLAEKMKPSTAAKLIAITDGVLRLDPVSAGAGMFMGLRAMLNTIIAQVIAVVIAGVFISTNPVALVVAFFAGGGVAQFANLFQLKGRIKTVVGEKIAEDFETRRRELTEGVRGKVEELLLGLQTNLDESLASELASVRGEVEKILEEQRQGKANAARKIEELEKLQRVNLVIEEKLEALLYEAGIGA